MKIFMTDGPLKDTYIDLGDSVSEAPAIYEHPELLPITKKIPDPRPGREMGLLGDYPVYRRLKGWTMHGHSTYTCINADNWDRPLEELIAELEGKEVTLVVPTPEQIEFARIVKKWNLM